MVRGKERRVKAASSNPTRRGGKAFREFVRKRKGLAVKGVVEEIKESHLRGYYSYPSSSIMRKRQYL